MQACKWQAPHYKQRLSLTIPAIQSSSPLSPSQPSSDAPDMQAESASFIADVFRDMIDSSQYELLERLCSRAGERALKRLCVPPDDYNALGSSLHAFDEQVYAPHVTCMAMRVVAEGKNRGMRFYTGCSDGRIQSMHFHFGDEVRRCM